MEATLEQATNAELLERVTELGGGVNSQLGQLLEVLGQVDRRQAFREDGAASTAAWVTDRLGLSEATARQWVQLATQIWDFPQLAESMKSGEISFDKARAAVDLALTTQSAAATASATAVPAEPSPDDDDRAFVDPDAETLERARQCTVRELGELARAAKGASDATAAQQHERRYLRCNDVKRTITAQLPEDAYALARGVLTEEAKRIPSDGQTPFDQRLCDGFLRICQGAAGGRGGGGGGSSRVLVVAHADLALLQGGNGVAELEGLGLLSPEAARRLACEADVALAIDDAFGHTMAEGRARRFPSDAQRREVRRRDRHCRFPNCTNSIFTNVHHIVPWSAGGGTDLKNLVLLCNHHHHLVHENRWQMSGNANGLLQFVGPTKRLQTSRPSPLWTRRN
jgi:hypothetical protein